MEGADESMTQFKSFHKDLKKSAEESNTNQNSKKIRKTLAEHAKLYQFE